MLDDDGTILFDSPLILEHLERRFPEPPLYAADPARRAEQAVFVEWFNQVWKRPPNLIAAELEKPDPHRALIEELGARMRACSTSSRACSQAATTSTATSRSPT